MTGEHQREWGAGLAGGRDPVLDVCPGLHCICPESHRAIALNQQRASAFNLIPVSTFCSAILFWRVHGAVLPILHYHGVVQPKSAYKLTPIANSNGGFGVVQTPPALGLRGQTTGGWILC